MDARAEFIQALMIEHVAQRARRVAMEHDTPDALAKYLKEHPGADRAQHSVKKSESKAQGESPGGKSTAPAKKEKATGAGKPPTMKGKTMGPNKPVADWKPADYEKFMHEFTYKDRRPMGEIFKNKADIEAIEKGMPKKLQKNFNYYKGVREKSWGELKNTEEGKAFRVKTKPDAKPADKPGEAKTESKSDAKPKALKKPRDEFFDGDGKFFNEDGQKPSSKEYVDAVEDAIVSKRMFGWNDADKVSDFMGKFNKLDQSAKNELAYRLIEEEHTPEQLGREFFKS